VKGDSSKKEAAQEEKGRGTPRGEWSTSETLTPKREEGLQSKIVIERNQKGQKKIERWKHFSI